jgi:ArsR family transcriptional regulator, cadmium/lead-responsive transcriptional repressor
MPRPSLETPFLLPDAPAEPDLVAKYFKVLSDPTRVRVLELLDAEGELSVTELVERLEESQPNVSNHLACLRWCGFVERERRHPSVYYRVADERVLQLLGLGRALLADNAEHVATCRRVSGTGGTSC